MFALWVLGSTVWSALHGTVQQAEVGGFGRPISVSVSRLIEFLIILGQDVEVTIKPHARYRTNICSRAAELSNFRASSLYRYMS